MIIQKWKEFLLAGTNTRINSTQMLMVSFYTVVFSLNKILFFS